MHYRTQAGPNFTQYANLPSVHHAVHHAGHASSLVQMFSSSRIQLGWQSRKPKRQPWQQYCLAASPIAHSMHMQKMMQASCRSCIFSCPEYSLVCSPEGRKGSHDSNIALRPVPLHIACTHAENGPVNMQLIPALSGARVPPGTGIIVVHLGWQ